MPGDVPLFSESEMELLKSRLSYQFGMAPRLCDGIALKFWKSGALKGTPRVPTALQAAIVRGLMTLVIQNGQVPYAAFTGDGLRALQLGLASARDSERFADLLIELDWSCGNQSSPLSSAAA